MAILGALRLANGIEISTPAVIDLQTSAWLSEGPVTFKTSLTGMVDQSQISCPIKAVVPPIIYESLCGRLDWFLLLPVIRRVP